MPIRLNTTTPIVLLSDAQIAQGAALNIDTWGSDVRLPVSPGTWEHFYKRRIPANQEPWFIDYQTVGQRLDALLWVDPALDYFAGHFPNQPILPGVVQLNWCATLAAKCWPATAPKVAFGGAQRVKFKSPIRPNQVVSLVLRQEAGKIAFSLSTTTGVCSQGTLTYRG